MGTGREDPAAAGGRGRLRVADADREHVTGVLKAAFAQGRLSRDELDGRTGRALAARSYGELDALTADIPSGPDAPPLPDPPGQGRGWLARPLAKSGLGADREHVIDTLKAAFTQGRLSRDELGARAGQALAARSYADLAALIADIPGAATPAGPPAAPAPARAGLERPAPRRPLATAAIRSGGCLVIASAAAGAAFIPNPDGPGPASPMLFLALVFLVAMGGAFGFLGHGIAASARRRRSGGQLPPRPGTGSRALEGERRGAGHGQVPPSPRHRHDGAELRARKPRQHVPARAGRTPHDARPAPSTA